MKTSNEYEDIDALENDAAYETDDGQEDVRLDDTADDAGDGDRAIADGGLIIVRQPKQSDADIATAEVSTVKPRNTMRSASLLVLAHIS